jgi:hypothetical protein
MDANGNPAEQPPVPETELYLPFGATDPDFHFPTDGDRRSGRFSRWLRSLPVFDR